MGFFSYAQGQLTPQSLVRSGRISKLSEMLWMFSLPARMKKIRSKMKVIVRLSLLRKTILIPEYLAFMCVFLSSLFPGLNWNIEILKRGFKGVFVAFFLATL